MVKLSNDLLAVPGMKSSDPSDDMLLYMLGVLSCFSLHHRSLSSSSEVWSTHSSMLRLLSFRALRLPFLNAMMKSSRFSVEGLE